MSSFIGWLEAIELEAARLYRAAADYFEGDLASFLGKLAEEELWHHQLLRSAALEKQEQMPTVILDTQTQENILALFTKARDELVAGTLTRETMLETIVAVEFSEWNEFFVYTLHQFKGFGPEYEAAVTEIGRHKHEIMEYFSNIPDGDRYLDTIRRLPVLAGKRILIIENYRPLALLLENTLSTLGEITLAGNGIEGLSLLESEQFDVVLSDVNMSAIEVEDFFEHVLRVAPQMRDRFVFFSGFSPPEKPEGLNDEDVTLLPKPAMISHIRRAVTAIAHRSQVVH